MDTYEPDYYTEKVVEACIMLKEQVWNNFMPCKSASEIKKRFKLY